MARMKTYQCPACEGRFQFMHHPSDEPPPRYCPLCGNDCEEGDTLGETLSTPHLSSEKARSVDGYYRATEEAADHRATMAESVFGLDKAEADQLRITNMRDNLREGDTTIAPVNNPVSQLVDANPSTFGFQQQAGLAYSAGVSQGPFPNAGARALNTVRAMHGAAGHTVTDRPALEMMQPGYRRRS